MGNAVCLCHRCKRVGACFSLLVLLLLAACGGETGTFSMKGEFKGFSQGEFYIYSTDGGLRKLDTVAVKNGQFRYRIALDTTATFMLVFPNFSEVPVFGASGAVATIEGDVSHLREIRIKGTPENELMTDFRLSTSQATPPELVKAAAGFIREHPATLSAVYLLRKYFTQTQDADLTQAAALASVISKAQPANKRMALLAKQLESMKSLKDQQPLPKFSAMDIKGKPIASADLYAQVNVITTWATWSYESMNIQRQLKSLEKEHGTSKLKIVSICLDASAKDCRKFMDRDSISWSNICDGRMWETPVLQKLGLTRVPDNIITDKRGKIIAHSLPAIELKKRLDKLLE